MRNKKIVFFVATLNAGGLENYLLRFLTKYDSIDAIVICKTGRGGALEERYVKRLGQDGVIKLKISYLNFFTWVKLYFILKRIEPETVCDFTGNFAGIPLFIAYLLGVKKRIAQYRGSINRFKENVFTLTYNHFVQVLTFKFSTKILSNSYAALDFFYHNVYEGNNKFQVIYNGIDISELKKDDKYSLKKEFGIPANSFVVGHTGRYHFIKNHETMIKVAVELCQRYSDIYFVFVGKGVGEKYSHFIKKLNLENQILFLGYRNDVLRILNLFDLYYFPSISEGQPNALIEAMVTGLPFVASNIDPIKETVPKWMHKQLLPPLDKVAAVDKIEGIYLMKNYKDYICTDWAKERYNADVQFEKLKDNL